MTGARGDSAACVCVCMYACEARARSRLQKPIPGEVPTSRYQYQEKKTGAVLTRGVPWGWVGVNRSPVDGDERAWNEFPARDGVKKQQRCPLGAAYR